MKKIKFPLILKDEVPVRTIEELPKNFDLNKITNYFLNGKLLAWLEVRYYEKEAIAVKALKKDEAQLHQKLCSIFGVEYTEQDAPLDMEEVEARNTRLARLKQYTSDETILSNVDHVAFDQEELSNLLDENVHDIYLCSNSFSIPLKFENRKYIGIGKVEAVINSSERVDFHSIGIEFENVQFDIEYEKLRKETPEDLYLLGVSAENEKDYSTALEYYRKAADNDKSEAIFKLGWFYENGLGVEKNYHEAHILYKKAADLGHAGAMHNLGAMYFNGTGVSANYAIGRDWYNKAIEKGNAYTMYWRGRNHISGSFGYEKNISVATRWINRAAEKGCIDAMLFLADSYYCLNLNEDVSRSGKWYRRAAEAGNAKAMYWLAALRINGKRHLLDLHERIYWVKESAKSGYVSAMMELAIAYYFGDGLKQSYENSLYWCKKVVDNVDKADVADSLKIAMSLPAIVTYTYDARSDYRERIEMYFLEYIRHGKCLNLTHSCVLEPV